MSYQTSNIGAENSGGGVTLNMIPKEGSNHSMATSSIPKRAIHCKLLRRLTAGNHGEWASTT